MLSEHLRTGLGYLNWLFSPFHGLDAGAIYDLLSTSSPTQRGLYLNLGYWATAGDFDAASEALAMLVGEAAQLNRADTLLDCGFGFGDQDILWAQTLQPARIIGLNITASQVAIARQRVAELHLDDRIELRHGTATLLPLKAESVDKVIALECAFHFHTRERFFREAWRVLKPGGRLVTADIIPMPAVTDLPTRLKQQLSWGLVASRFAIPNENAYTRSSYHAKLAVSGFKQILVESIRDKVYAPLHRYLSDHPQSLKRLHPMARLPARMALRSEAASVYAGLDYVLATGIKQQPSGV